MAKIICVKCQKAMRPSVVGVVVVEMALEPPIPYKVWQADLFKCPTCKEVVVTEFANKPLTQLGADNYQEVLKEIQPLYARNFVYNVYE